MRRITARWLTALLLAVTLGGGTVALTAASAAPAAARSCSASIYPGSRPNVAEVYTIKIRTNPCGERISAQIYCRAAHRWRYGRIHTLPGKTSFTSCGITQTIRRWGWRWQVAAGLPWTFVQVGVNNSA